MRAAIPLSVCGGAAVIAAYFIVDGVGDLFASRSVETPVPPAARETESLPAVALAGREPPDARAILARNIFDSKTGPLWPPPPPPESETEEAEPEAPPEPGPCDDELRISGSAYVPPERGRPLVVFSGPDEQRSGARGVGMQIADKTVTAIYPNVVVLTDAKGAQCWMKMRGLHAMEVAKIERRDAARVAAKKYRAEAKRKAALRREARKKKKKKR